MPPQQAHHQRADDRRRDRERGQEQRQHDGVVVSEQRPQEHRRDHGHGVGLEQVGGHAGVVADVVAHVVGDHRRVAGIVLGDAGLDLADQVGADVGGLREDAAAEAGEHRDQRAAEREPDERLGRLEVAVGLGAALDRIQDAEVRAHAQEPEADDEDARDRAALERDRQRRRKPGLGRLGRAHVRPHRDVHADEARERREHRPDQEPDRDLPAQVGRPVPAIPITRNTDHGHAGDGGVLALQVGGGALLDGGGDLLHPLSAGGAAEHPTGQGDAVGDRERPADEGDQHRMAGERTHVNALLEKGTRLRKERADCNSGPGRRRRPAAAPGNAQNRAPDSAFLQTSSGCAPILGIDSNSSRRSRSLFWVNTSTTAS